MQARLPHLDRLLSCTPEAALAGAETVIVAHSQPEVARALLVARPASVLDLDGRLGSEVEALPGYEGVAW